MTSAGILQPVDINNIRPPYVRWSIRAVRDHVASVAAGYGVHQGRLFCAHHAGWFA